MFTPTLVVQLGFKFRINMADKGFKIISYNGMNSNQALIACRSIAFKRFSMTIARPDISVDKIGLVIIGVGA